MWVLVSVYLEVVHVSEKNTLSVSAQERPGFGEDAAWLPRQREETLGCGGQRSPPSAPGAHCLLSATELTPGARRSAVW